MCHKHMQLNESNEEKSLRKAQKKKMEEQKQINSRKFNISQRSFSVHFNVFCFALAAGGVGIHQRQKRVFFLKIFFRFRPY